MQHQWTPDTASIGVCVCGAKRRILPRVPRSPTETKSRHRPEYLHVGATEWSSKTSECTRPLAPTTSKKARLAREKAKREKAGAS